MINKVILNNLITIFIKNKRKYLKISLNKKDLKYLNFFIQLNLIKFIKKKSSFFILYLNLADLNVKFKNLYKPGRKLILKNKEISKICLKRKKIFLISTNKGLLFSQDAKNLKCGGLLLYSIIF